MSSDVRPAARVGSHQSAAPREINTVEHQPLLAESLPSFRPSFLLSHLLFDPQTRRAVPAPAGQVIALIKVKATPRAAVSEG